MSTRFDSAIYRASLSAQVPFSHLKALVDVMSGFNVMHRQVNEDLWSSVGKFSDTWQTLYTGHYIATKLGISFQPNDEDYKMLYCASYGLTGLRYDRATQMLGFKNHPCDLLTDPMKNLEMGGRCYAMMCAYFAKLPDTIKWQLGFVSYMYDGAALLQLSETIRNNIRDRERDQLLLEKGVTALYGQSVTDRMLLFRAKRDEYMKQELQYMTAPPV